MDNDQDKTFEEEEVETPVELDTADDFVEEEEDLDVTDDGDSDDIQDDETEFVDEFIETYGADYYESR